MRRRTSWAEKLADSKGLPVVQPITGKMIAKWGSGTMAIPSPMEIDALMRQVPAGRLVTIRELRAAVAQRHGATIACPITTGIFAWIAAHAAVETSGPTPWWRTLKSGGEINPKYPGGVAAQKKLLRAEGHRFVMKGARTFVADFEAAIQPLQGA
jgi:alkylated DNA nucleotide flippase Atl1